MDRFRVGAARRRGSVPAPSPITKYKSKQKNGFLHVPFTLAVFNAPQMRGVGRRRPSSGEGERAVTHELPKPVGELFLNARGETVLVTPSS